MSSSTRIPVYPKFGRNAPFQFGVAKEDKYQRPDEKNEHYSELVEEYEDTPAKKSYDWMVLTMVIIIIILITIIIWLVISNSDEKVPERMVMPQQFMRPPGPYYPQPGVVQAPYVQQAAPPPAPPVAQQTRQELDETANLLKKKNKNNEKLPINDYVVTDSKPQSLEDIVEEDSQQDGLEISEYE